MPLNRKNKLRGLVKTGLTKPKHVEDTYPQARQLISVTKKTGQIVLIDWVSSEREALALVEPIRQKGTSYYIVEDETVLYEL